MNALINVLIKVGLLKEDLDYHLIRASMVVTFLFFGYQKWFEYEAQVLIPYISNGPLIFWMYPVFGIRGAKASKESSGLRRPAVYLLPPPSLRELSALLSGPFSDRCRHR